MDQIVAVVFQRVREIDRPPRIFDLEDLESARLFGQRLFKLPAGRSVMARPAQLKVVSIVCFYWSRLYLTDKRVVSNPANGVDNSADN